MSANYSKAFDAYGASMGRRQYGVPLEDERCRLHRVPLDRGGYDPGGAYWGSGEPLWRLQGEDCEAFVRAASRFEALLKLQRRFGFPVRLAVPFRQATNAPR